jgi:hypothetical protein
MNHKGLGLHWSTAVAQVSHILLWKINCIPVPNN